MTFSAEDRAHFEAAIARARQDGVPEEVIRRAVDEEIEFGLDPFSEFSLAGRLRHLTGGGHPPRQAPS